MGQRIPKIMEFFKTILEENIYPKGAIIQSFPKRKTDTL